MASYLRTIATINMGGAKADARFSLLSTFLWENDVDIVFLQELAVDCIRGVRGYMDICNVGDSGRGTGFLIRNNLEYSQLQLIRKMVVSKYEKLCQELLQTRGQTVL